ncbi:hypothetical protein C1752_13971 [Acaryochloris thomasi RCC1774]|uniref:Uncharacterized protein n=2 Tax=Acaryochloris TaxID=155977 RepID=A0A2W1J821_9CYAN|nr:hypothetical protein C1752_13971 [Acaryochloris thomasi RCC1774]
MAEAAVDQFLEHRSLPIVLIQPGTIFGPSDAAPSESGRFVLNFLQQKVPFILTGGLSIVDARDVAQAMITAVKQGQSGERYLVGGQYHSAGEILTTLSEVSGVKGPQRKLPGWAMHLLARLLTLISRLTGQSLVDLSVDVVKIMLTQQQFNSAKAMDVLDVNFRPLLETLRDTVAWYRDHDYCE